MTNEPTPETDAKLASDPHPPSDWPEYARALEIQRNAARAERDALRADSRELKALLLLLARAIHDENWTEIGNLVPRMTAAFAAPAQ